MKACETSSILTFVEVIYKSDETLDTLNAFSITVLLSMTSINENGSSSENKDVLYCYL